MSRRNRIGKPQNGSAFQSQEQPGQNAPTEKRERQSESSVITLHLGGRNPFRCYNAYLITGSKHVLVDPGPPGSAGELLEQLSRHRISLGEIGLIVITHGHPDHYGSASQFKEWTRAPLAVHELDAEYVNFGSVPVLKPVSTLGSIFKPLFKMKADPVEPEIILHDGDKLNRYAGQGRVIQTPGHTAGSISILLPDGNCIVGDLLMRGLSARTPSLPWYAEDLSEARESLQRVVRAGARTLLAGHGGPFDVKQLAEHFPWLEIPEQVDLSVNVRQREQRDTREVRTAVKASRQTSASPRASQESQRGNVAAAGEPAREADRPRRRRPRRRRPQGYNGEAPPARSESD